MARMWDLVPRPGVEPGPPALGAWRLTHWTTREVSIILMVRKLSLRNPEPAQITQLVYAETKLHYITWASHSSPLLYFICIWLMCLCTCSIKNIPHADLNLASYASVYLSR